MNARFAIGIGARRGVDANELASLVRFAAAKAGVRVGRAPSSRLRGEGWGEGPGVFSETLMKASDLLAPPPVRARPQAPDPLPASGEREDAPSFESVALFTIDTKREESGLHEAARELGTKIVFLPLEALLARKDDVLTRSTRVEAMTGVGSIAEAAALAGAGPGSVLLAPRAATKRLTCAIARAGAHRADNTP